MRFGFYFWAWWFFVVMYSIIHIYIDIDNSESLSRLSCVLCVLLCCVYICI